MDNESSDESDEMEATAGFRIVIGGSRMSLLNAACGVFIILAVEDVSVWWQEMFLEKLIIFF